MKLLPKLNAMPVLVAVSLCCGLTAARLSAETRHTPTKMPTAKAESVGMSTEGLNRIDEVMQEHIDAGHIQGAVTIVARRGKVVHFSTHGEMDVKNSRAMEPDAVYRMASSTKPVIGVAAMMMVDQGLINLSDPVSKYIPKFAAMKVAVLEPAANSSEGNLRKSLKQKNLKDKNFKKKVPKHRLVTVDTPMTIHHLLTHTSGLMSGGLGSAVNPVMRTSDDTLETYVAKLAKVPLDFQPGTRWAYGNAGIHAVVPRIIEIVSETPFEEFMRERVLNPLEMNSSYFSLPSDKESKRVVVMFKGREVKKKSGGTGLSSTAEDYLHFQQMLLNGGEFLGNRLLRPESVEMMSSNQVGDLFTRGKKGQKGMGFGYTVAVTLDPDVVANHRGKGAFGWGGAGGTMSWTDPENELVAVLMLQQPRARCSEILRKPFGRRSTNSSEDDWASSSLSLHSTLHRPYSVGMGVRLKFNLRTAMALLLMASLASYYLLAHPEAILASKLVRVMTETNARHAPKWTRLSITPETSSKEIITNRRILVRCFVQDLRRSGLYDRPLPVVLSEMGFDADEPDSFFLAANFDEIWPEFKEKTTSKDPADSWFARKQRQGFWYELRRCFQLH